MLITLTIGGNDLLSAFGNRPRRELLDQIAADVAEAYDFLVDTHAGRFPNATIVLTTVYDPSDGHGAHSRCVRRSPPSCRWTCSTD